MIRDLPIDLLPRVRQLLMPFVPTEDDREALTEAFLLYDPLLYRIERRAAPKNFPGNCIKTLIDYRCLAVGEHTLSGKHAKVDALIGMANALRKSETPAAGARGGGL